MRGLSVSTATVSALFAAVALEAQPTKVGYVNSEAVLAEFALAQDAQNALQASLRGYDLEIQELEQSLRTSADEFLQKQLTMTPEARQAREEELRNQEQALQQRRADLNTQAQQRQVELFQPVMDAIKEVIEEIRVEGDYAIILDVASRAIITADPALDLTQEVVSRLQTGSSAAPGGG